MKRSLLVLAGLAVLVSACGSGGRLAAVVNGHEITVGDVEAVTGGEGDAIPRELFSEELRNLIVERVVLDAAERDYDINFDEAAIDVRLDELKEQIAAQTGMDYETFLEAQGFTDDRVRRIAHQQLVGEAIQEVLVADADPVSDDDVRAAYESQVFDLTEACIQHVLLETEEEALSGKERLDAGEDFGEIAAEISTDPSAQTNAGDLGCGPLSQYVPEFANAAFDATIGEVTEPVESSFGYHLILVESRSVQTFEEAEAAIRAQLDLARGGNLVQGWLLEVVNGAEIEVDSEFGQWSTDPVPQIIPSE